MIEIYLHLRRPTLMGQRIDINPLRLTPIIKVFKDWVELIDCFNTVALARRFWAA